MEIDIRHVILTLGLALLSFVILLAWALESGDVAVLETRAADGSPRQTRVWFAEAEGQIWLEAATPERAWFVDLQRKPEAILEWDGARTSYRALDLPGPTQHQTIRNALREKYGVRDQWVGLLQDTSRSILVRLEQSEAAAQLRSEPARQESLR